MFARLAGATYCQIVTDPERDDLKARSDQIIDAMWDHIVEIHAHQETAVAVLVEIGSPHTEISLCPVTRDVARSLVRSYPELTEHLEAPHAAELVRVVYVETPSREIRYMVIPAGSVH